MEIIFNTVKEYKNMFQITTYNQPLQLSAPLVAGKRRKATHVTYESVRRTKSTIRDLCYCNRFTHFVTFTFDRHKADRYSLIECQYKLTTFLRASKYHHSPDLKYLVVPELHKDGAIHFHALLSGYNGKLKFSKRVTPSGKKIYNLPGWRYGYTNATEILDYDATVTYVTKYITKDMVLIPGKKRYFSSKELIRPVKSHNRVLSNFKLSGKSPVFSTRDYNVYIVEKNVDINTMDMLH